MSTEKLSAAVMFVAFAAVMFSSKPLHAQDAIDYRLLATNKTSTMEKELNEAAGAGYRFERTMGGSSAFGGQEVISVMSKGRSATTKARYEYKLLATKRTSTMEKEMQDAANEGYEYRDQTVFNTTFGGDETVVILERERGATPRLYEYKLLATNKTSTMEKEIQQAGNLGFQFVGVTVGKTAVGGKEVITILRRMVK